MFRFKDISEDYEQIPSPLLFYAEALMYTALAQNDVPNKELSIECIK